LLINS